MDVADQARWRSSAWVEWWLTVVLGLAAAIAVGFGILLALSREDSEPVELTLLLAIARQLRAGPWELYGPFNAANLLVLIHAPFYYHLAVLLAWPLSRVGIEPITAALVAGRFLSVLGLLATLAMAYRLARLDGAPARAGVWAILLVAAVPVMGSMPYSVRPDLLGIAFQTAGVLFVLGALGEDRRRGGRLLAAFAAFALAFCIKQHFIVAAAISVVLCLSAWRRGGVPFKLIERGLLVALGIAAAVYGTEELMTGGRMSRAVFLAARSVGGVHPGSWYRAEIVAIAAVAKSAGLLTLLAAAGLAAAWASPGRGPRALASAGAGLAGMVLVFVILQLAIDSTWLTAAIVTTLAIITPLWIAAGLIRGWREMIGERLDGILWLYVLGETALVVVLFRASTGAWVNYAIQATVFVAVVTGRARANARGEAPFPVGRLDCGRCAGLPGMHRVRGQVCRTGAANRPAGAGDFVATRRLRSLAGFRRRPPRHESTAWAPRSGVRRMALPGLRGARPGPAARDLAAPDSDRRQHPIRRQYERRPRARRHRADVAGPGLCPEVSRRTILRLGESGFP